MVKTLEDKILNDLKISMKNRDTLRTSTLRMVKAAMDNFAIEKKLKNLEDLDVIRLIAKQVKQHEDSIEGFKKGNRPDLVEKESKELEILKTYIPQEPSQEEIVRIVQEKIGSLGATNTTDFGRVMKSVMEELKGGVDGRKVSLIVNEQLTKTSAEEKK